MLKTIIMVGMGSCLGGIVRYLLSRFIQNYWSNSFPVGTLAVNVLGCLAIGLFYGLFEQGNLTNSQLKMFLTVGLCGGFTTFSTFANENVQLIRDGHFLYFSLYTSFSLLAGFLMIYAGYSLVKWLF